MRVASRGNLTVELIRMHRFAVDPLCREALRRHPERCDQVHGPCKPCRPCPIDKVEIGRETLEIDPWSDQQRQPAPVVLESQAAPPTNEDPAPESITPVVGSPALAGLGVALIVPGTLLDVVA